MANPRTLVPGDIIMTDWDPAVGHEMRYPHPGLVVSSATLNKLGTLIWICPISQGAADAPRKSGFLVPLMGTGTRTSGMVHVHQLRCLDLSTRNYTYIERLDSDIVTEVMQVVGNILPLD